MSASAHTSSSSSYIHAAHTHTRNKRAASQLFTFLLRRVLLAKTNIVNGYIGSRGGDPLTTPKISDRKPLCAATGWCLLHTHILYNTYANLHITDTKYTSHAKTLNARVCVQYNIICVYPDFCSLAFPRTVH